MIYVCWNNGAAPGYFVAHEFRSDNPWHGGTECFTGMLSRDDFRQGVATLILAYRNEFHFRCDDALACIVHLADVHAEAGATGRAMKIEAHLRQFRIIQTRTPVN